MKLKYNKNSGFSVVEIIIAIVVFGILITGTATAMNGVTGSYAKARELNEIYAALSGCPEIDRALQYDSIVSTNCSPNDTFDTEGLAGGTIVYSTASTPTLTSSLASTDPAYNIPDSKVVDVTVTPRSSSNVWKIRLLISRNGIGQQ